MNPAIEKHLEDFRAACAKLNIPAELPQSPNMPQALQDYQQADTMLLVLIAADREPGFPDYNNYEEGKYVPWFEMDDEDGDSAGSGFRLRDVFYGHTHTYVGAPFVFPDEPMTKEFTEKYIDLYRITKKNVLSPVKK